MKAFEFPFKHFNKGAIFEGEAMTQHDPGFLVLLSGKESRMVIRKEIISIDDAINARMKFSDLLDKDDTHREQAINVAQALAAVRNRLWFATNPDPSIPDFNDGDSDQILWQHGTWDFDNSPIVLSLNGKTVKKKKSVDSDDYQPRKVLTVTTHSKTSRGIRLTIEMTAFNIRLMWSSKTWGMTDLKEQDFKLTFESGVHWTSLEKHFPKEVADRICYIYALFQKAIMDRFSDLMFEAYC